MNEKPKPYTAGDLMRLASTYPIILDPLRVLATYADPSNWTSVHVDQRHYWAWSGPMIVGYELAGWPLKHATNANSADDDGAPRDERG